MNDKYRFRSSEHQVVFFYFTRLTVSSEMYPHVKRMITAAIVVAGSTSSVSQQVVSRFVKTANSAVLQTPEGVAVTLVKGAIANQQVSWVTYRRRFT